MSMKLLHLVASPRGDQSRTLAISETFLSTLRKEKPEITIDEMDLFKVNLPPVNIDVANAKYALMKGGELDENTQKAWDLIMEHANNFMEYDIILVSSPMWNYSVPYVLKHYIDLIMQAGVFFRFTSNGAEGLAGDKKVICVTTRGSDYGPESPMNTLDYLESYMRAILELGGVKDITFINAQPLDWAPGITQAKMEEAKEKAVDLARSLKLKAVA